MIPKGKQMLSCFLCIAMVFTMGGIIPAKAQGEAKYDGDYSLKSILSRFQVFVQEDYTGFNEAHTMGAVAVGGTLDLNNSVGDAGIVPSYAKNIKNVAFWNGSTSAEGVTFDRTMYYGDSTLEFPSWVNRFVKNPEYMDVSKAFTSIRTAADNLAAQGRTITQQDVKNGTVTVNFVADKKVIIPAELLQKYSLDLRVPSVEYFKENTCVISVTGDCDKLNFCGDVMINGRAANNQLKALKNSKSSDNQVNLDGMNLVWNLPDTKTVTVVGLTGHLVAPRAVVYAQGGNYEGGIIAKSMMESRAEGHFYKYAGEDLDKAAPEEDTITVTKNLQGVSADKETAKPAKNTQYSVTLKPDEGKEFTKISVSIGNDAVYTVDPKTGKTTDKKGNPAVSIFDPDTGELKLTKDMVTGNIVINAAAQDKTDDTIKVTKILKGVVGNDETTKPAKNTAYTITLKPEWGKEFSDISVTVGDAVYTVNPSTGRVTDANLSTTSEVAFDVNSGKLTINADAVTADITILAVAKEKIEKIEVIKRLDGVTGQNEQSDLVKGQPYEITLVPDTGKHFTEISVTVAGKKYIVDWEQNTVKTEQGKEVTDITYRDGTLKLTGTAVTGNISIVAVAKQEPDIKVTKKLSGVEAGKEQETTKPDTDYTVTLTPDTGKTMEDLTITIGDKTYTVDLKTGDVKDPDGKQSEITYVPANTDPKEGGTLNVPGKLVTDDIEIIANAGAVAEKIKVTKEFTSVKGSNETEDPQKDAPYTITVTPDANKQLKKVSVSIGNGTEEKKYTVDVDTAKVTDENGQEYGAITATKDETGAITLRLDETAVTADIKIVAVAEGAGITVRKDLINVTAPKETETDVPEKGKEYTVTLKPSLNNEIKDITIQIGKEGEQYKADPKTGKVTDKNGKETTAVKAEPDSDGNVKVTISKDTVTGDITVTAIAESTAIKVTKRFVGVSGSSETTAPKKGQEYTIVLKPMEGGQFGHNSQFTLMTVQIGSDSYTVDWNAGTVSKVQPDGSSRVTDQITFAKDSGKLTIKGAAVTQDITIVATAIGEISATLQLQNVTKSGETVKPQMNKKYTVTLTPNDNCEFKEIGVQIGNTTAYVIDPETGAVTDAQGRKPEGISFDTATGELVLEPSVVTDDIVVIATADEKKSEEPEKELQVTYELDRVRSDKKAGKIPEKKEYKVTLSPDAGRKIVTTAVQIGDIVYTVDPVTGKVTCADENAGSITAELVNDQLVVTIPAELVTEDIKITAKAEEPKTPGNTSTDPATTQSPAAVTTAQTPGATTQVPVVKPKTDPITVEKKLTGVVAKDETVEPVKGQPYEITFEPEKETEINEITVQIGDKVYTVDPRTGEVVDKNGTPAAIVYDTATGRLWVPGQLVNASMVLTCKSVIKKVPILKMNKTIAIRSKFKINLVGIAKDATVSYRSSNKKIAKINKKGVITGKKLGKCKIYADVIQNGSYYRVKINLTVRKKVIIYSLTKRALSRKSGKLPEFNVYKRVFKNKKTKITFMNVEKNAKVTYTSSNPKIATVKKQGKKGIVYGKKQGFTVVTAKIVQNGKTYITRVFVRVDDYKVNKTLPLYLKELK